MSEEWGPWIEHYGSGCPCKGKHVQAEHNQKVTRLIGRGQVYGTIVENIATGGPSWTWEVGYTRVIRYRIRKPKGMAILESILREVEREPELV